MAGLTEREQLVLARQTMLFHETMLRGMTFLLMAAGEHGVPYPEIHSGVIMDCQQASNSIRAERLELERRHYSNPLNYKPT